MKNKVRRLIVALLFLALPASLLAQRSPAEVLKRIEKGFKKEKIKLNVELEGATAILTGQVRNVFAKNKAVEIALDQPEIEDIEADIEIAEAESADKLGQEVVKQIRRYGNLTIFDDASAFVKDGNIVLMGFVTEPYKKVGIEKRMHNVLGIQEFKNQIEVLPNSMQDARLRQTLANRLYRDSMFSDYARMAHPPIRIIVNRSRVLLTGVVLNKMAKQRAESIIRQTLGVLSVESKLRFGS
ncbi:MAG: BON domain-containing protein [Acidobacteria bacterium]|nr:MAG: BON domain-containing protein [Acidobacteriota bacterium]